MRDAAAILLDARRHRTRVFARGLRVARIPLLLLASAAVVLLCVLLPRMAGVSLVSEPAVLVVLGAAILSSIVGFAFSALCGAMLLHLIGSPLAAVQIMLVCSIGIQSLSVWMLRRDIDWHSLPLLLAGGVLGLPAGQWLLFHLSRTHYTRGLGLLLAAYGLWMLLRRMPAVWPASRRWGIAAGALGGITGGLAALPGPPATIWCALQGWDKTRQRAVMQPFILIMQILSLALLYAMGSAGMLRGTITPASWAYLPAALGGTIIGLATFRRLSDRQFACAVNALLILSGLALLA